MTSETTGNAMNEERGSDPPSTDQESQGSEVPTSGTVSQAVTVISIDPMEIPIDPALAEMEPPYTPEEEARITALLQAGGKGLDRPRVRAKDRQAVKLSRLVKLAKNLRIKSIDVELADLDDDLATLDFFLDQGVSAMKLDAFGKVMGALAREETAKERARQNMVLGGKIKGQGLSVPTIAHTSKILAEKVGLKETLLKYGLAILRDGSDELKARFRAHEGTITARYKDLQAELAAKERAQKGQVEEAEDEDVGGGPDNEPPLDPQEERGERVDHVPVDSGEGGLLEVFLRAIAAADDPDKIFLIIALGILFRKADKLEQARVVRAIGALDFDPGSVPVANLMFRLANFGLLGGSDEVAAGDQADAA